MSDLMADKTVEFLREAANYFANRPTNGEDRAYWANVYNSEKCIKAADEIEQLRNHVADQQAEIEGLRTVLELYRDAVRIDAMMEGPKFMGANSSALKRAWDADLATLGNHNEKGY